MFGKEFELPTPEELENDIYVSTLERERDWIYERLDAIRQWAFGEGVPVDAAIKKEYWALNTRLDFILAQIGTPDEESLWTCDEISAQITEEELVKARERLYSATERMRYWINFSDLNGSWTSVAEQRKLWTKCAWERKEEVFRLEDLLIDNPASGWIPF